MTATTEPHDRDLDARPDAAAEPTVGLVAAAAAAILLGVLISSATGSATVGPGGGGAPPGTGTDALPLSLAGFRIAQLVIGCLGVLVVTSEYATGMIRATFAAVTNRLTVLRAKVLVFGAVTIVVTSVAALISFAGGHAVYQGGGALSSISDPGVLRVILGMALYTTGFGLIGIALGFLLRSTAAAIGALVAALMVVPVLIGLLPGTATELWSKYLPTNAGSAFTTLNSGSQQLSPGAGRRRAPGSPPTPGAGRRVARAGHHRDSPGGPRAPAVDHGQEPHPPACDRRDPRRGDRARAPVVARPAARVGTCGDPRASGRHP